MKREIKFRAWYENEMLYDHQDDFDYEHAKGDTIRAMHFIIPLNGHDTDGHTAAILNFDSFEGIRDGGECLYEAIVMQYTGIEDKNGREIYEGDILKRGVTDIINFTPQLYVIKFHEASFKLYEKGEHELYTHAGFEINSANASGTGYEIIGNIYENPELLQK